MASGGSGPSERALRARDKVLKPQDPAKALKVKTAAVSRLKKELAAYQEEVVAVTTRVENMRAEGRDEHDIKKQAEVLAETEMMIPDTARRLDAAVHELADTLTIVDEYFAEHGEAGGRGGADDDVDEDDM